MTNTININIDMNRAKLNEHILIAEKRIEFYQDKINETQTSIEECAEILMRDIERLKKQNRHTYEKIISFAHCVNILEKDLNSYQYKMQIEQAKLDLLNSLK